jgi:hypothetical protein
MILDSLQKLTESKIPPSPLFLRGDFKVSLCKREIERDSTRGALNDFGVAMLLPGTAHQAHRSDENHHPSDQYHEDIEPHPIDHKTRRRSTRIVSPEEKHLYQVGCRTGADVQAEQYTENTVCSADAEKGPSAIEPAGVSHPHEGEYPQPFHPTLMSLFFL